MRFVRLLLMFLSVLLVAVHNGTAQTDSGQPAKEQLAKEQLPGASAGVHDMLLLLPDGPVHLRVTVTEAGKSLKAMREDFLKRLAVNLDTDQNGKVSRKETAKHPLFVTGRRFDDNKFLDSLRAQKDYTEKELAMAVDRVAGQLITFRQNNSLTDQDLSVFRVLDENESGLIERVEMRTSAERLAKRDLDFDQCITFDEFLNQPVPDNNAQVVVQNDEPPSSVHSETLRDATEPIIPTRLVKTYDKDRDAKLSAKELNWTEEACRSLDLDGDHLLSVKELSAIAKAQPDLQLAIDLADKSTGALRVVGGRLVTDQDKAQPGQVKITQPSMSLSVGYRQRDPIAEAERNSRAAFNAIDVDGNGYLDRKEIVDHQRFQRYLFDAMDADGDDRVFAEEMLSYVKAYTEPATTSCQVTLFDTGNGYFQMLDANSDGRISIRELRKSEENLLKISGQTQEINPSRMTKSFRIELQRGGIGLFGRVDRPEAESPTALLNPPTGPMWFQRMDRNGDSDLVWDEFLGPREVFHRMDRDADGLIDVDEAERFEQETRRTEFGQK